MKKTQSPFFLRFVEEQPQRVTTDVKAGAGKGDPIVTLKYPSDNDEWQTLKYPSDDDEYKG